MRNNYQNAIKIISKNLVTIFKLNFKINHFFNSSNIPKHHKQLKDVLLIAERNILINNSFNTISNIFTDENESDVLGKLYKYFNIENADVLVERARKNEVKMAKNKQYSSISDYTLNLINGLISNNIGYFHQTTLQNITADKKLPTLNSIKPATIADVYGYFVAFVDNNMRKGANARNVFKNRNVKVQKELIKNIIKKAKDNIKNK